MNAVEMISIAREIGRLEDLKAQLERLLNEGVSVGNYAYEDALNEMEGVINALTKMVPDLEVEQELNR